MELTLADILTLAGATAAAALVTGLTEVVKRLFTKAAGHEQQIAASLAAFFVGLAMTARISANPPATIEAATGELFLTVFAWYGITRLSMGIHDDVTQRRDSLTGPTGAG